MTNEKSMSAREEAELRRNIADLARRAGVTRISSRRIGTYQIPGQIGDIPREHLQTVYQDLNSNYQRFGKPRRQA